MALLDMFKIGKKETVETVDAKLLALATERQTIAARRETLTEVIAAAYGTPDGEAAESEYSRLEARLKALQIVEGNLHTERQAAEVRAHLAGYQQQVNGAKKTYDALQVVEQGDNGLLVVEARYKALLAESNRLRHNLIGQLNNLNEARSNQPAEIRAGIEEIDAKAGEWREKSVMYTAAEAQAFNSYQAVGNGN